ncbi:MAG TPA: hypothetical protein VMM18_09780 [Gemmatimonadaceae bacterium]|nr:hypothetical protein [Gemmatimonadaceae bacterium]
MVLCHRLLAVTIVAAAASFAATPAQAQQSTTSDTASPRLPAVVTTARKPEGLLSRVWHMDERRREVILLEQENRMLKRRIRQQDRQIARLEVRLDTLKAQERRMTDELALIDSATTATRLRRAQLEAQLTTRIARRPDR